jgi:hypothetical protein
VTAAKRYCRTNGASLMLDEPGLGESVLAGVYCGHGCCVAAVVTAVTERNEKMALEDSLPAPSFLLDLCCAAGLYGCCGCA